MANQKQLQRLQRGVKNWNLWRQKYPHVEIDLSGANLNRVDLINVNLSGANLSGANLSGANLSQANLDYSDLTATNFNYGNLREANLREANLHRARLIYANLCQVNLFKADLTEADFSHVNLNTAYLRGVNFSHAHVYNTDLSAADLVSANLQGLNFSESNLSYANLIGANLSYANLSYANLSYANLSYVNLNYANLIEANLSNIILLCSQLLNTNLTNAIFTGACLEDWHINHQTNLDGVICDYVYLKGEWDEIYGRYQFSDRRPGIANQIFQPGDFSKLFNQNLGIINLVFNNGIDWKAFSSAWHKLEEEQRLKIETQVKLLSIRALEQRDDGSFVVSINVPFPLDSNAIEIAFQENYQCSLKAIEKYYQSKLHLSTKQINSVQKQNASLEKIVEALTKRVIKKKTKI